MEQETRLYEAMFLVDSAKGGSTFPETIQHISDLLQRHDADIERIEKWDERELCYPIQDVEKGIYILTYFRMVPEETNDLRDAINLSEDILRVLILKDPKVSEPQGELYSPEGEVIEDASPEAEEEEEAEEEDEEADEEEAEAEEEEEEDEEEAETEEAEATTGAAEETG